jgi:uncharacterized membrane protein YfcA
MSLDVIFASASILAFVSGLGGFGGGMAVFSIVAAIAACEMDKETASQY